MCTKVLWKKHVCKCFTCVGLIVGLLGTSGCYKGIFSEYSGGVFEGLEGI